MKKLTPEEIKKAVLDNVWDICNNDGDYLINLIEWAYRDYKSDDYKNEFITMGLHERETAE